MSDPRYVNVGRVSWITVMWLMLKYPITWVCLLCEDKCPAFSQIKDRLR
jgi:hypothetical protein